MIAFILTMQLEKIETDLYVENYRSDVFGFFHQNVNKVCCIFFQVVNHNKVCCKYKHRRPYRKGIFPAIYIILDF